MPEVSIIVPVYNVERYLPECLDSVLGQDFTDFEIVAVNDCSPDGSDRILERYARQDSRIRILSLERNVGLGRARNAGLETATGRFIWFLDSDDSIRPGALSAIVARAHETDADLVLFGWTRDFEDGRSKPGSGEKLLRAAPKLFTAAEWPRILEVLQIAWNKLIRRDLLERTGLRFVEGYYEDTPFTYPLLASARAITALPDAFVSYRQRSTGAITSAANDGHVEVLSQWERAMALVDTFDTPDAALRREIFPLMVRHCSRVLLSSKRIPAARQHEYVGRLQGMYRRYHPGRPYRTWHASERLQHRLVRLGSLPLLKLHWKIASALRNIRRRPVSSAR